MTIGLAPTHGWQRFAHSESAWGTAITWEFRAEVIDAEKAQAAISDCMVFVAEVDRLFSTYRPDSVITALRNGLIEEEVVPPLVRAVLHNCRIARDLSRGAFDPWALPEGVDPSGYVKGWAADLMAQLCVDRGFSNVTVNAGGDISCRGYQSPEKPWVIGIQHPLEKSAIIETVEVLNAGIATSAEYERGEHIFNPRTGDRSTALSSATVIGPDAGLADALATACVIQGKAAVEWFTQLPGWSVLMTEGETMFTYGPAFSE